MSLDLLLIIAFGGAFLTYFAGKISSTLRDGLAVLNALALVVIIVFLYGQTIEKSFYFGFFGLPFVLRINTLSWLFALIISSIGALSIIFSLTYIRNKEKTDFYYGMLLLVNSAMLGIVLAGELALFFIFWEIMSWSTFLMICYKRGPALVAGMKYIVMSIIGSMAMLVGVLSIYSTFGTLTISELPAGFASASPSYSLFIMTLFFIGFGVKNAIIPFHTWLPYAHAEAPSPFSAILSGVLIKIGTYGFILFIYVIIGAKIFLNLGHGFFSFRYLLSILAAITIIVPTFIAIMQDDAKKLLAWSTIGQAGYIFIGIVFGTSVSVTSGMFHFFNHALFKSLLFLVVGAIEYRTNGIRDLNSLGGLIKKMPITFIAAFIGVSGLIGIPLTNGFVSKWLIYKTLILEGSPFLAFAALFGTWGTILYSYKFLHNIFLGQLPENMKNVKKAPFNMQIPFIILSFGIILFGILPGIPLKVINTIIGSFGLTPLNISIWGITSETGVLNTVNIFTATAVIGLIIWLVFRAGRKSRKVDQYNNYAAGAAIPKDKYNYTVDFYKPLYRMISPYCKDIIDMFYKKIAEAFENMCDNVRKVYTGYVGSYVMYIMLFLASLIFVQLKWSIF